MNRLAVIVILSEAKDRFLSEAVQQPWMDSDPSVASLPQDDIGS
jgi:hypothetical protein